MHPLHGALPGPYVPVRGTRGALWSHIGIHILLLAAGLRCTGGHLFPSHAMSLWNGLEDLVFVGVRLVGFKSRDNVFL